MADTWEDWEDEEVIVVPAAAGAGAAKSKFLDEDEEEEAPKWAGSVPTSQQAKGRQSKYDEGRGAALAARDEAPLDDPIAEKLRQQRLVEESDFKATLELFGGEEAAGRSLEGFLPKSAKDFEEYGRLVAAKHLLPHARSSHYKALLKQLLKAALSPVSAQDAKDIETSVAGARADKLKEEKTAAAGGGKKGGKGKGNLNLGKGGGTAGLDDYIYADDNGGDDYDFM